MMTTEQEEPDTVSCEGCSSDIPEGDSLTLSNGDTVCSDCYAYCERCEDSYYEGGDWWYVEGDRWCESCHDNYSFYCNRCENTYNSRATDYSHVDGDIWCQGCVEHSAYFCEECESYTVDGCSRCGALGQVHDYNYKPNPIFNGTAPNNLYMGFELEMELNQVSTSGYREAVAMVEPLESDGVCYLKRDGSISGTGFELVTHPHTLAAYDQANGLWDYIEKLRTDYKARSWDTESCGLHVHVSRSAFRSGAHTHRFLSLIYKNPQHMMKLAGRKNSRYAKFSDVYEPDEWGIPRFNLRDKIHQGYRTERYSAVNTGNDYTLELRFFRGNMKREGVMSALELCHASVEYTRDLTLSDVRLGALSWDWFADWVGANNGIYPNLYLRMSKVSTVSLNNKPLINA